MKKLTLVKAICNPDYVVSYYFMQDTDGLFYVKTKNDLVYELLKENVSCDNLKLSLVDEVEAPEIATASTVCPDAEPNSAVDRCLTYLRRMKLMGTAPDADYVIDGEDVILKRAYVKKGTFVIQDFVTKLWVASEFEMDSYIHVHPIFPDAEDIRVINNSQITDMSFLFASCRAGRIDLQNFDTSKATNMYGMFYMCKAQEILGLENFNTSNVISMHNMFAFCRWLKCIDISNFDTSKCLDFSEMFSACDLVQSLDLSKFNTSSALQMCSMFYDCKNLRSADVSHFDTSKVRGFVYMFSMCKNIEHLDVSNFDLSSAVSMDSMFCWCQSLKKIVLNKGTLTNLKCAVNFITGCQCLEEVDLSVITKEIGETDARKLWGIALFEYCKNMKVLYLNSCFSTTKIPKYIEWLIARSKRCPDVEIKFK